MAVGTVKWFNEQKGFGFIQPDGGGNDVFVHISAVERAGMRGLAEGQKVSYEMETDKRSGKQSAGNLQTAGTAGPTGPDLSKSRSSTGERLSLCFEAFLRVPPGRPSIQDAA